MGFHSLTHSRFPYGSSFTTMDTHVGFQGTPESPMRFPRTPEFLQNRGFPLLFFSIPLDPFWVFFHLAMDPPMGFLSPSGSFYGISFTTMGLSMGFLSPPLDPPMGFLPPPWIPLWDFFHLPGSPYGISFTSLGPPMEFLSPPRSPYGISFTSLDPPMGFLSPPWIPLWDFFHLPGSPVGFSPFLWIPLVGKGWLGNPIKPSVYSCMHNKLREVPLPPLPHPFPGGGGA
jgi:hypothetical protein